MVQANIGEHELPNIATFLAEKFEGSIFSKYLHTYENLFFSFIIIALLCILIWFASRKTSSVPNRLQCAFEIVVGGIDDFVCGIIGPKGRVYTPFIGTLFIYILSMNLMGLAPLLKSPTSSWSTTLALAICVFIYVQYAGIRQLGLVGYVDHLLGRPRGIMAFSIFIPVMMLMLHVISELVRPISLSLRLRSNIWGDDMLLAVFAGFGLKGMPILFFNSILMILAATVQAVVFCLLTTIYFALALVEEH